MHPSLSRVDGTEVAALQYVFIQAVIDRVY